MVQRLVEQEQAGDPGAKGTGEQNGITAIHELSSFTKAS